MNKYLVYLEDSEDVYKVAIPAEDEADARRYCEGNGEVIMIRDVTDNYPISADRVAKALEAAGFNKYEVDFVVRTLEHTEIADWA